MEQVVPTTIDEYIAACPPEVQPILHTLRRTIVEAAPRATEKISWDMATFSLYGNLIHFSVEKAHIGLHPRPSAIIAFAEELKDYACSKGTIRLPFDRPLPLGVIRRIVAFRVAEQERMFAERQAGIRPQPRQPRPRYEMPEDVRDALCSEHLHTAYKARPPYQRNDYIGWITAAKRAVTREKRLRQMLGELAAGDTYMGQPYRGKKPERDGT